MCPDNLRDEYLRIAAARSGLLSRFLSIQRELLHHIAGESGRVAILAARDAALVVLDEYREMEEMFESRVDAGLFEPVVFLERLIVCRRILAARIGERVAELLEKRVPQSYPEPRKLFFGGTGQLTPPPGGN